MRGECVKTCMTGFVLVCDCACSESIAGLRVCVYVCELWWLCACVRGVWYVCVCVCVCGV